MEDVAGINWRGINAEIRSSTAKYQRLARDLKVEEAYESELYLLERQMMKRPTMLKVYGAEGWNSFILLAAAWFLSGVLYERRRARAT